MCVRHVRWREDVEEDRVYYGVLRNGIRDFVRMVKGSGSICEHLWVAWVGNLYHKVMVECNHQKCNAMSLFNR